MPVPLIITEKAQKDLDDAFQWYEKKEPGLGKEFIRCIDAKIAELNRHPHLHPIIQSNKVRRAFINRFPFSIYFVIDEGQITIFAILHQRRNPDFWESRIESI